MRIALVCNYPWDPDVIPGGVTAVAHCLARGLAGLPDVDLHVVCCQQDVPSDCHTVRDGATIHFLTDPYRFSQPLRMRPQRRKVARLLKEIRPDLVHAQGLGLPAACALDSDLPSLVTVHGIFWREPNEAPSVVTRLGNRFRAAWGRGQFKVLRNVVVTSGYVGTLLPSSPDLRTWVINNPVSDELFAIENRPDRPHVLVVGGLRRRKDPLTSLRVMERVLRDLPNATMHLLGVPSGTPLDTAVARHIAARGLGEHIRLLGLVPSSVLREEYGRASLLLMPSLEETAPVALGEAHAVGLPMVGTAAGGIPYLIREGETGFVRPVGDVEGLAERVLAILRDDGLRHRLAGRARQIGRAEFALAPIAQRTAGVYREILGGSAGA